MAARFWVLGTGNWDAVTTTNWSTTSGGSGGASVPGASDDVTFDGNSGGGTVTLTTAPTVLSITGGTFTGTLNTNSQNITVTTFSFTGTATRGLTLGSSTITVNAASGIGFDCTTSTNLTLSAASSTIIHTNTSSFAAGTSLSWGTVSMTTASGALSVTATTAASFVALSRTAGVSKTALLTFTSGVTYTVGTLTLTGNSKINRLGIQSSVLGTAATLSATTLVADAVDFKDITATGSANWNISGTTNFTGDEGGNTGITFTSPTTQTATGTVSFVWSTHGWTSRVPLAQDTVVISNSFSAGQTITVDMPRIGKDITFSCTGNPTISLTAPSAQVFGSMTLPSGATTSGGNAFTFLGRGTHTFTTNGVATTWALQFTTPGVATISLQDALTNSSTGITIGTAGSTTNFSTGNFNITLTGASASFTVTNLANFDPGTSLISIGRTAAGTFWSSSNGAVFISSIFTIKLTATTANTLSFAGGNRTYGILDYTVAGSTGTLAITLSNSFSQIKFSDATNARTLSFGAGTITTIRTPAGFSTIVGTAGKLMSLSSSASPSTWTLSINGGTVSSDYLAVTDGIASGAINFYAGANGTLSNTTNWTATAPPVLNNQQLLLTGMGA